MDALGSDPPKGSIYRASHPHILYSHIYIITFYILPAPLHWAGGTSSPCYYGIIWDPEYSGSHNDIIWRSVDQYSTSIRSAKISSDTSHIQLRKEKGQRSTQERLPPRKFCSKSPARNYGDKENNLHVNMVTHDTWGLTYMYTCRVAKPIRS